MKSLGVFPFNHLAPDNPDYGNPGMEGARNCIARTNGYTPLKTLEIVLPNPIAGRAVGGHGSRDSGGITYFYVANPNTIQQLTGITWGDVSRVAPYTETDYWEFALFQQGAGASASPSITIILAASPDNVVQFIERGGSNFANIPAPASGAFQASTMAAIKGHMAFGVGENLVRWSAQNNALDNEPNQVTLSGSVEISGEGGRIQRLLGGEYGMLFQERSTWRVTYVGSPNVFQLDEVDPGIGILAKRSAVQQGADIYFLSEDGFRMTRGDRSVAIGEDQIDRTVLADVNLTKLERFHGAVFQKEQCIVWAYPAKGSETPNKVVIYNYGIGKWTLGDEAIELFVYGAASGFQPLDNPDGSEQSFFDDTYGNMENIPGSLDDDLWTGALLDLTVFDVNNQGCQFVGPPRAASFQTQEPPLVDGKRMMIKGVRPIVDGGETSIRMGYRKKQSDPIQYTAYRGERSSGYVPFRKNTRYPRFEVEVSGDWETAAGLEVFGDIASGR